MVGEGVEDLHGQRSLPQRFVAVQEPYQHRQEYLTLCDLSKKQRVKSEERKVTIS